MTVHRRAGEGPNAGVQNGSCRCSLFVALVSRPASPRRYLNAHLFQVPQREDVQGEPDRREGGAGTPSCPWERRCYPLVGVLGPYPFNQRKEEKYSPASTESRVDGTNRRAVIVFLTRHSHKGRGAAPGTTMQLMNSAGLCEEPSPATGR